MAKADDPTGVQISIRVPQSALKRADALLGKLSKDEKAAAVGKVTRSAVLRLAFLRGLDAIEAEYK